MPAPQLSAPTKTDPTAPALNGRDPVSGAPGLGAARRRLRDLTSLPANRAVPLAVVAVHLSRFQELTSFLGQEGADQLLGDVAQRLTAAHGSRGAVCRALGPSFVAVFDRAVTPDAALILAESLLHALREPFRIGCDTIGVEAHAGVVWHDGSAVEPDLLLRWADSAALTARRQHRPTALLFEPEVHLVSGRSLRLREELRTAIVSGQLCLEFQPVVSLADGRIEGAEALVRWNHPELGTVYPLEFLPGAEQRAVAESLTEVVLDQALEALASWQRRGLVDDDFTLAVNVSAVELSGEVDRTIAALLEHHGVSGESIILEVTETSLLAPGGHSVDTAHRLRALGVQVAVDDFGSAYSSLLRLLELPVTCLKIDAQFVRELLVSPVAAAIIDGISTMASTLDLMLIAEGVEEGGQAEVLRQYGVPAAQGYLWSPPLPLAGFDSLLRDRPSVARRPANGSTDLQPLPSLPSADPTSNR